MKKLSVDFTKPITRNQEYPPLQWVEGSMAYSVTNATLPGTTIPAARFELRASDPTVPFGSKRSEITVLNNNPKPDSNTPWLAFKTYQKSSEWLTDSREEIFPFQFHDLDPISGKGVASPSFAIEVINNRFRADIRWSVGDYLVSSNRRSQLFDLVPVPFDRVNDWVVYYIPHVTSGVIKIWLNGKQIFNYTGPCQYQGSQYPFLKTGIYGWKWTSAVPAGAPTLRVGYVAALSVGDSAETYESMGGQPSTPVPVPNKVPTVSVVDMTATEPFVILDATAADADGVIKSFQWIQVSGPNQVVIESPKSEDTKVSGLVDGTYEFQLTVTDDKGATAVDSCKVTIAIPPPAPKVVVELLSDNTWRFL